MWMKDEIRNVTLSFPCGEDWRKFEVVPGGRLCDGCKHIVRDFTHSTMTELKVAMKAGERICGRFRKTR